MGLSGDRLERFEREPDILDAEEPQKNFPLCRQKTKFLPVTPVYLSGLLETQETC